MPEKNAKPRQKAEILLSKIQKLFKGESKDIPASELNTVFPGSKLGTTTSSARMGSGLSALNQNINDYVHSAEGRTGSRVYTLTKKPEGTLFGVLDHRKSKLIIKVYGSDIYTCDKAMQSYQKLTNISGVLIDDYCKIIEYGDDALIFSTHGMLLVVLSDDFNYVRRMNQPVPSALFTDIKEDSTHIYGYRYTYSLLQRKGSRIGSWNRVTPTFYPVFESGTCLPIDGKDYGEFYFTSPVTSDPANVVKTVVRYCKVPDGVFDVTHFGIYRTLQIGENTIPAGSGASADSLQHNPSLYIWANDIPVAKAFVATQTGDQVIATQGTFELSDIGSIIRWDDDYGIGIIMAVTNGVATVDISTSHSGVATSCVIGGGRIFEGYQSGTTIINTSATEVFISPYMDAVDNDVGKPVFWADGRISWIRSISDDGLTAVTDFIQTINPSAFTMVYHVKSFMFTQSGTVISVTDGSTPFINSDVGLIIRSEDGEIHLIDTVNSSTEVVVTDDTDTTTPISAVLGNNFTRNYGDSVLDDGLGVGEIGLTERNNAATTYYQPKKGFIPLPNCNIGVFDFGYVTCAIRDGTEFYHSDTAEKPDCAGYYRADFQEERVTSQIRDIRSVGSVLAVFMKSKTRTINAAGAEEKGDTDVGESIMQYPSSILIDNLIGVIAWESIQAKGANLLIALTNEPAIRLFDGTTWGTANLAQDMVQKDLNGIDPFQKFVSIYAMGKHCGYKIWFKEWVEA